MGDNGQMYVPEELLSVYQETILPLADVITPNQFEIELITDRKISNIEEAWKAMDILHEKGSKTVVISSSDLLEGNHLLALASSKLGLHLE